MDENFIFQQLLLWTQNITFNINIFVAVKFLPENEF